MRDAACYVCWSFARAYNPVEIKPFIEEIARYSPTVVCVWSSIGLDWQMNCSLFFIPEVC